MENLIIGEEYNVSCQRKGKFKFKLTYQCETWASGIITQGRTKAIREYNELGVGEEVTVRKSFCSFTKVSNTNTPILSEIEQNILEHKNGK